MATSTALRHCCSNMYLGAIPTSMQTRFLSIVLLGQAVVCKKWYYIFFIFYNSIIDNSDHLTILIIIIRELFEIIKLMFEIIKYHLPMIHCHADDSQVYISFSPNDRAEQLAVMRDIEDCIRDVRFWMLNVYLTGKRQEHFRVVDVWLQTACLGCKR